MADMRILARLVTLVVVVSVGVLLLAALLPGFSIDGWGSALAVVAVTALVNGLVWPSLRWIVAPIGVLTLGLGALLVNALVVGLALDALPGVTIDGLWAAVLVTLGLSLLSTLVTSVFAVDDDEWFDRRTARTMARHRPRRGEGDAGDRPPGLVVVQLDGLARPVLERAMRSGDAPTLARWISDGRCEMLGWTPEWSCQTGVSQCGILHGDVTDMPAFRWLEKDTGRVIVSNHPKDAAEIERRHSRSPGLLSGGGSSYGNLFTGGAERAVLTMSVAGATKEHRIAAGYGRYFARPYQSFRTLVRSITEIARERQAARDQVQRDVRPRVSRDWTYALLRTFTTVISRDVCMAGVLNDMAEGRPIIYVDFLGFDEVSHHSGPERHDSLRVIRGLDRDIDRIDRARQWCRRSYEIVVLSDHGQTQGATFAQRYGEGLAEVVARCTGGASTGRSAAEEAETESSAMLRSARGTSRDERPTDAPAKVLASGNLGLVYLSASDTRMTLQDIERVHPDLVSSLASHPGVGFVLVECAEHGPLAIGGSGRRVLRTGVVEGVDPLAVFGPDAVEQVSRVAGYTNLPDLMVNSLYDPHTDEVAAFEHQVSSHGGLGGDQQRPFVLRPLTLDAPDGSLVGPVALHRQLWAWRRQLGHEPTATVTAP
jgi:uncharacterized membrane protein YvlD (DUF360 family)